MHTHRPRAKRLKSWPLPKNKHTLAEGEPAGDLPPPGFFGKDDFMRVRFFSALIERYATKTETDMFVTHARAHRMVGMSFADTLEAMGSYLHMGPREAKDRLLAETQKPKETLEREYMLTGVVKEAMQTHGANGTEVFKLLVQALRKLYPGATDERIKMALDAGNSQHGFSVPSVIEVMNITEPMTKCDECKGATVMTKGLGLDTQIAVCSKWKEPGHLDAVDIELRVRDIKKALRPSGRFA